MCLGYEDVQKHALDAYCCVDGRWNLSEPANEELGNALMVGTLNQRDATTRTFPFEVVNDYLVQFKNIRRLRLKSLHPLGAQ